MLAALYASNARPSAADKWIKCELGYYINQRRTSYLLFAAFILSAHLLNIDTGTCNLADRVV